MANRFAGTGLLAALLLAGCGQWRRVGSEGAPKADMVVPALFDLSSVYHRMGFLAHGPPVAFVAAVRFLAGPLPDSTLALLSISLANNTLSFRRAGLYFEATYRVEATLRSDSATRRVVSDQTVRVGAFHETQRADESVIFQQFLHLPPGEGQVWVTVRDENTGGYSRDSTTLRTPRFDSGPAISSIVPIYAGTRRGDRTARPDFVLNPRGTVPYGSDTLRLYVETYGMPEDTTLEFRALDEHQNEVWRSSATLVPGTGLAASLARIAPGTLPIGELRLEARAGGADTARAPVLVSFSEQWVVANFDEVLNLLRYFGYDEQVRAMREAPSAERPELWRAFWRETDPNPTTPDNEAISDYFTRIQQANQRYREGSEPGWQTDRGEVFITMGEPDEVLDRSSDLQGSRRAIRWTYTGERLVLDFRDDSGFGRFRLTPASRAEYQRVLARIRRL